VPEGGVAIAAWGETETQSRELHRAANACAQTVAIGYPAKWADDVWMFPARSADST
jgi:hypothetical protein